MVAKVAEKNGQEYANTIDYFTPLKYEQIRKRVLDQGNECSRKLLGFLDYFDFIINKEKVEDTARQKRTVTTKKVIVSHPTAVE